MTNVAGEMHAQGYADELDAVAAELELAGDSAADAVRALAEALGGWASAAAAESCARLVGDRASALAQHARDDAVRIPAAVAALRAVDQSHSDRFAGDLGG